MLTRTIFSSSSPSGHVLTLEWFHCGGTVIQPWSDSTTWYALQVWDKQLTLPGSLCILGQRWAKSTDATVAAGLRMYGRGTWQHVLNPSSSKNGSFGQWLLYSNYDAIPNSLLNPCKRGNVRSDFQNITWKNGNVSRINGNVSATHQYICICTFHRLSTILTFLLCMSYQIDNIYVWPDVLIFWSTDKKHGSQWPQLRTGFQYLQVWHHWIFFEEDWENLPAMFVATEKVLFLTRSRDISSEACSDKTSWFFFFNKTSCQTKTGISNQQMIFFWLKCFCLFFLCLNLTRPYAQHCESCEIEKYIFYINTSVVCRHTYLFSCLGWKGTQFCYV